jgi:hypothetical protein
MTAARFLIELDPEVLGNGIKPGSGTMKYSSQWMRTLDHRSHAPIGFRVYGLVEFMTG